MVLVILNRLYIYIFLSTNKILYLRKTKVGFDKRRVFGFTTIQYIYNGAFGLVELTNSYEDVVKNYGAVRVTEMEMNIAPDSNEIIKKIL